MLHPRRPCRRARARHVPSGAGQLHLALLARGANARRSGTARGRRHRRLSRRMGRGAAAADRLGAGSARHPDAVAGSARDPSQRLVLALLRDAKAARHAPRRTLGSTVGETTWSGGRSPSSGCGRAPWSIDGILPARAPTRTPPRWAPGSPRRSPTFSGRRGGRRTRARRAVAVRERGDFPRAQRGDGHSSVNSTRWPMANRSASGSTSRRDPRVLGPRRRGRTRPRPGTATVNNAYMNRSSLCGTRRGRRRSLRRGDGGVRDEESSAMSAGRARNRRSAAARRR